MPENWIRYSSLILKKLDKTYTQFWHGCGFHRIGSNSVWLMNDI